MSPQASLGMSFIFVMYKVFLSLQPQSPTWPSLFVTTRSLYLREKWSGTGREADRAPSLSVLCPCAWVSLSGKLGQQGTSFIRLFKGSRIKYVYAIHFYYASQVASALRVCSLHYHHSFTLNVQLINKIDQRFKFPVERWRSNVGHGNSSRWESRS